MKRAAAIILAAALGGAAACGDTETEQELDQEPAFERTDPVTEPATTGRTALAVDSLGPGEVYLTDADGRALYLLEGEPADSSTCYDACAEEWPPFTADQGQPTADAEPAQQDLIGTIQRRDGRTQVTYDGTALYYYHDDTGPGQTAGQDLTDQWGEWYLVRPDGEHLEASDDGNDDS